MLIFQALVWSRPIARLVIRPRERKPSQYPRNPLVIRPIRVPTAFLGQAKPDPATGGGIIAAW